MRGRCPLIALVASCSLLAACSDDGPPGVSPSSAFPATGATGAARESGGSGTTGILPTTSPARGTGTLSEGEVTFSITGDVRADRVVLSTLISAVYTPPPGGVVLVWTAGGTDASTLGIGGSSFVGSHPTAPSLSLTLTVQTEGTISTFVSSAGECTITIDVADAERIGGSFACADLSGGDGETVDATGSFSAQG